MTFPHPPSPLITIITLNTEHRRPEQHYQHFGPMNIYKTFFPTSAENAFFSRVYEKFTKSDYILGYKANYNKNFVKVLRP